ncbi:MAG: patatin-like phospholipase family protein [Bdellovibrionota bacterium]
MNKLALVLSGGNSLGIFQAGVCEVLATLKDFANPDIITGTSAGAINAALLGYGYTPQEMVSFWKEVGHLFYPQLIKQGLFDIFARPFAELFGKNYNYLLDTEKLRKLLIKHFKGETLPLLEKTIVLNTVNAKTGQVIRICNKKIEKPDYIYEPNFSVDSILASAAIPVLFKPIERFNTLLWDGGLLVNTPLTPATDFNANRIVPVLCSIPDEQADVSTLGNSLSQAFNIMLGRSYDLDRKMLLDKNELSKFGRKGYGFVDLYSPIRPNSADNLSAWASFNYGESNLDKLYNVGKDECTKWFENLKLDSLKTEMNT